ncbi:MAG TPA: methyltransferase domain-containing protein [Caldimonas sp.]|nr:methyltransferase domain-containing protein [Caldimonas sp.]HEV7578083.1 methyltransferase domain-containing protein [Caldimonas sp.]
MSHTDPAPHVFNASMGARLEVLYASPQIVAQRRRFRALLDVRAGESGVDVGCGVGHLTCELAEDVGPGGRMTGVDASADMLAGAAARVRALRLDDRVALHEGDAVALGLPDASADFVVAVQTYSYLPDVAAAVAEAARVLRPGGRLGVLDTDWDLCVYGSPDVDLMRRIFDGHWRFEHAHLPRELDRLFRDAGLTPSHAEAFPLLETRYDADSFGAGLLALGRNAAVRHGVDRAEADAWVADVRTRGERGDWFFCLNRFMFVATKA